MKNRVAWGLVVLAGIGLALGPGSPGAAQSLFPDGADSAPGGQLGTEASRQSRPRGPRWTDPFWYGVSPRTNIVWEFDAAVFWWSKSFDSRWMDSHSAVPNLTWELHWIWDDSERRLRWGPVGASTRSGTER
jgi:hypothetical protein